MKSFQLYKSSYGILVFLILTIFSCKREETETLSTNGKSMLVFNVAGIKNKDNKSNKLSSKAFLNNAVPDKAQKSTLKISDKVSLISSAHQNEILTSFGKENTLDKRKLASSSLLHDEARFRILLYNETTGLLEKNVEATAGGDVSIEVTTGNNYKWYAYSYNSSGAIEEPIMENNIPTIRTLPDKEFIWTSSNGTFTPSLQKHPLSITFDHMIAEVVIEIDTKELYGNITDLSMEFLNNNYFNTAKVNLLTGAMTNTESYTSPSFDETSFTSDFSGDPTIRRAVVYTAVPTSNIESLTVLINKLTVQQDNGIVNELLRETETPKTIIFDFANPDVSKSHVASIKPRYNIPTKRILHVIGHQVNNDDLSFAFAAQPTARDLTNWTYVPNQNYAPLNMIKEPLNFGNLPNSIVGSKGFTHERCLHNELNTKLTSGTTPDIVIISVYYLLRPEDIVELIIYINNGGVVIMMTDSAVPLNANNFPSEAEAAEEFMQTFINNPQKPIRLTYGMPTDMYYGPLMYELDHENSINDRIINGPFGDLRGKYWGNDSYAVVQAIDLPIGTGENEVTVYSDPQAINSARDSLGVSMFKHNSKNFFWIGDGSFLSHTAGRNSGWSTSYQAEPFATVFLPNQPNPNSLEPNHTNYPVPKRYGVDFNNPVLGNVGFNFGSQVYNAPLFANLMSWALYQSEFYGINN